MIKTILFLCCITAIASVSNAQEQAAPTVPQPKVFDPKSPPVHDPVMAKVGDKHGDYYYQFFSFDMCCRGVKRNYHIVVGRSKSVTGPYIDRAEFSMMDGRRTVIAIGDGKKWAALGHNSV